MPGQKLSEETRREEILRAAYDVAARQGVEALTLRAVAKRAAVSHGTVLFHFTRRDDLVASLLDRVIYATIVLRLPDAVADLTRPVERLRASLRAEMERLSEEARHFRLFLEYWALGVRDVAIRRRISGALDAYRSGFRSMAAAVLEGESHSRSGRPAAQMKAETPESVAAIAVSIIHGCALQAVIDPRKFDVQQHLDAATRMLDRLTSASRSTQ